MKKTKRTIKENLAPTLDHILEHVLEIDKSIEGLKVVLEPHYETCAVQLFQAMPKIDHLEFLKDVAADFGNCEQTLFDMYSHLGAPDHVNEALGLAGFQADQATTEQLAKAIIRHAPIISVSERLGADADLVAEWFVDWKRRHSETLPASADAALVEA